MLGKEKVEITDNFIGIFDNFFSNELIQQYLNHFKYCEENDLVWKREDERKKKDLAINTMTNHFISERNIPYNQGKFIQHFYKTIWPIYEDKFAVFKDLSRHTIFEIKIQKTKPTEGYHIWHGENMHKELNRRIFAFNLYLNDIKQGGETEFLYQKFRVKPKKNRFVIWPASITHAHRGNPPLSNDKYLLTGWIEFE